MIRAAIRGAQDHSPPPPPARLERPAILPRRTEPRPVWRWVKTAWAVMTFCGSLIGASLTFYVALPSFSLSLPSSSYRPRNPFTAIFVVSNSGYLRAVNVHVQCIENMIRYTDPANILSGAANGGPIVQIGTVPRNSSRTFSCPQLVQSIQTFNRALTAEEVKKLYEQGPPTGDMAFAWADFELRVSYQVSMLPVRFTEAYRVTGKPSEDGTFVWEQVALDKKF
jgi:hypothetical protein